MLSTDPQLAVGTPVKAGDRITLRRQSVVVLRETLTRLNSRAGQRRGSRSDSDPPEQYGRVSAPSSTSHYATATTPSSATEVSSALRGMTRTV